MIESFTFNFNTVFIWYQKYQMLKEFSKYDFYLWDIGP